MKNTLHVDSSSRGLRRALWQGCRGLALVGMVALVAGCPTPTGRMRGPTDGWGGPYPYDGGVWPPYDGGPGVCDSVFPGGYCGGASSGAYCVGTLSCASGLVYVDCQCVGSTWECNPPSCEGTSEGGVPWTPRDEGPGIPPPSCPPGAMVSAGSPCEEMYEGLFCAGATVTDCDGSRRALSCACVSGQWYCDTPSCGGR